MQNYIGRKNWDATRFFRRLRADIQRIIFCMSALERADGENDFEIRSGIVLGLMVVFVVFFRTDVQLDSQQSTERFCYRKSQPYAGQSKEVG